MELLANAAQTAYYDAMEAEYEACLAWWNCDNSGGGSSSRIVVQGIPTRDEANTKLGLIKLDKARLVAERAELMQQLRKAAN